ncbi:uncharacterized protein si:dkey-30e9.6 [Pristis pectinata]|uniref:uncharacterized protein si:dkey-30e9.6 n=1 Tax=Pristis pectinata TaxID=685728 RepID=UPI00223D4E8F|nr:uncharacterized protein si:dkey-30e9.6 [Pristis pectinata]
MDPSDGNLPRNNFINTSVTRYNKANVYPWGISEITSVNRGENKQKDYFSRTCSEETDFKLYLQFKILDPFEAKIMFVKTGKYETGAFEDSKPHDFRQYENDVPNFVTSFDRDPFNLKFESKYLNTVHEHLPKIQQKKGSSTQNFDTYKPQELKWDSRLILKKEFWLPKSGSYTRHKRHRDAYSAFMDRVEEKITKLWQKEQELQHRQPSRKQNSSVVP